VFDVAHSIIATSPVLSHLRTDIALTSFCPEDFVGIGVPKQLRFFQTTRLQYSNSHIMFNNRGVRPPQYVDCKIVDALLKKGTKQHGDGWDVSRKDWSHMVLHLPHTEGGFGVTFN